MFSPLSDRQILVSILILAFALFACTLGAAPAGAGSQPTIPGGQGTTQPPAAATSGHGTLEQAKTMLQKAVEHYNAVGRTQALQDFTGRAAPFFQGDLYVACIDSHLIISANGGFPNLVGSSIEPLSRAAWDAATDKRVDSVNYSYTDPVTKTTEPKTFYYEKVGTDVCGVGVYHP